MVHIFHQTYYTIFSICQIFSKKYIFVLTNQFSYSILVNVRARKPDICASGSVGGARPCQGRGRGFESRLALFLFSFPAYLVIDFYICYNATRHTDMTFCQHNHQNETLRVAALRVSCSFTGNQSEVSCHCRHCLTKKFSISSKYSLKTFLSLHMRIERRQPNSF